MGIKRRAEGGEPPARAGVRPGVRRLFRLALRTPTAAHDDVDAELESLIANRVEHLLALGMTQAAARAEAVRRLGASLEDARGRLHQSAERRERRMRVHEQLESLAQDLRYAARGLVRRPLFTAIAVLTLAIGIGATTAIFSAVNTLLLQSLPFARPDELMNVWLTTSPPQKGGTEAREPRKGSDHMVWSYPKFSVFRDAQTSFSSVAMYTGMEMTITDGDVELVRGEFVGATYLRTLGLRLARGRDFDPSLDAAPGAPRRAILSYALWERRFNLDPSIVGKTIDLNREPYAVVGIAPRSFAGLTGQSELFVPVTTRPADDLNQAWSHEFLVVARRKPGVTAAQATSAAEALGRRVNEAFPDGMFGKAAWGATAQPLDDARVAPVIRRSLLILFGAVAFVLLIACVNVANLLLGRSTARRREIAVRLAIGAGRGRLVRLLLTESILLALLGAIASVLVAWLGVHALNMVNPATTLRLQRGAGLGVFTFSSIRLDWISLAFTLDIAIVVGLVFGLAPALHAARASVSDALKDGHGDIGRFRGSRASRGVGRRALVVVEVALALVLLAGSGLMLRSLGKLLATNVGFDPQGVLTVRLTVPPGGLARDSLPGFYTELLDRLRGLAGVTDAAIAACAPLSGGCNGTVLDLMDRPRVDFAHMPSVGVYWTTPTWFTTMRVPLERGRPFTTADRAGLPKVVLINEAAARQFWPHADPIGKRVGVGQGGFSDGAEVIGVVGDVRQWADSAAKPGVYLPYLQSPSSRMMIFIRTAGDPAALGGSVRAAIHGLAPQYPVYDMQPMSDRAAAATAQARFSAVLLGLFAATALSLAGIGIYGVMSLAVAARSREIGIRIALGADRGRVQRLVIGEGVVLVTIGAVVGVAGALLSTRVLRSLLFDLTPSDPATYAGILALLGVAAITASWIPARRASRVDPVVTLRTE